MTYQELMKTAEVIIAEEDKKELLELLETCNKILEKYPSSNNSRCSYVTKMGRAKDGVKDAKTWCESLKT